MKGRLEGPDSNIITKVTKVSAQLIPQSVLISIYGTFRLRSEEFVNKVDGNIGQMIIVFTFFKNVCG